MNARRRIRRAWARARDLALRTPPSRNRYVDFLRAASIVVVVLGHWLMAAPTIDREAFTLSDMLYIAPWTQWLTWIFQVMPLFFVVGGYANAASWLSYRSEGEDYAAWVSRRLRRLVGPVIPVILAWCVLVPVGRWLGLNARIVDVGSTLSLRPLWFLAVYVLVVVVAPFTHALWERYGIASFWAFVLAAVAVEVISVLPGLGAARWLNYAFVWLAFHQLGCVWRYGGVSGPRRSLAVAAASFVVLLALRAVAGYPVSMVTVPGDPATNTNPPSLALLALGITHAGIVLALEAPAKRWLENLRVWIATIAVNAVIMTIYVWHVTVMVLLVALLEGPGGAGLRLTPNSPEWWLTRPLWVAALLVLLALAVAAFGRLEAIAPRSARRPVPGAGRSIAGALAVSAGLGWLSAEGAGATDGLALNVVPVACTLVGALLILARGRRGAKGAGSHPEARGG
ncbi:MAG TPA: acyltransferase [Woeseiaceae bacterium]|nr:acyltransferase [Woeseiaceae bacterium]